MAYLIAGSQEGPLIELTVSSKLTPEVYRALLSRINEAISKHGKVRLLCVLLGFQGWAAGVLWDNFTIDPGQFERIEQLAVVGESKWETGMTGFCLPFTAASKRFFELGDLQQAREWIGAPIEAEVS